MGDIKLQDYFQGDEPPLNKAMNDLMATAGGDEDQEFQLAAVWVQFGAEVLARTGGRQRAMEALENTKRFVRDAQPSRPWKK